MDDIRIKEFTERIQTLLDKKKMTQAMLADRMGVSQQVVSSWVNGKTKPNLEHIFLMADAFEVSPEYMLIGYNEGVADVGKATGLSQEAIDDLIAWNTAQDAPGLVNALLTIQSQISKTDHITFDRIVVNVMNAIFIKKKAADAETQRQRDPKRMLNDGVMIDDRRILYSTMTDGLIAQCGEIFTALIREYIRREMSQYAKKNNP